MPLSNPSFRANGTIQPSTFVKMDTTAGEIHSVLAAGANGNVVGVAQAGSLDTPGLTGAATDAARDDKDLLVYGIGEVCLLKVGGTVTPGMYLKSDANSAGVDADIATAVASPAPIYVGAKALEHGTSGQFVRVQVVLFVAVPPKI